MSEVIYCDKVFYKYRPINKYTDSLLKNNELYFNYPNNFNDPFDCKLDYSCKYTYDELVEFFSRKGYTKEAKKLIEKYIEIGLMKQEKDEILIEPNFLSIDYNIFRVCCFSETEKSLLMWSHYADCHKGICLSFKSLLYGNNYKLPLDTEDELPFHLINYDDKKPKEVNLLNRNDPNEVEHIIRDFFITKFTDWKYEQEYRLLVTVNYLKGKDTVNFRKDALEGVIFGLKISQEDALHIKKLIDEYYIKKGINVNLYRIEKVDGKYAIDVKEIKDFDRYIRLLK